MVGADSMGPQRTISSFFQPRNAKSQSSSQSASGTLSANPNGKRHLSENHAVNGKQSKRQRHDIGRWSHTENTSELADEANDTKSLKFRQKVFGTDKVGSSLTGERLRQRRRGTSEEEDKSTTQATTGRRKLKPMEQQIVDLKRKHPDGIMLVETGYKYKMYGDDARKVCHFFDYTYAPGWLHFESNEDSVEEDKLFDRFASWSFPTERLLYYVRRLVNGGFKVAVVNQTEAAAVNAVENKGSKIINRAVTSVQTRGTFVSTGDSEQDGNGSQGPNYLMAISSCSVDHMSAGSVLKLSIAAVDVSTGELILDEFEDSSLFSEMETRLLHIQPCELLLVDITSKPLRNLINSYANSSGAQRLSGASTKGPGLTIEDICSPDNNRSAAEAYVDDYFENKPDSSCFTKQSANIKCALYGLVVYLKGFMLEHVFELAGTRERNTDTKGPMFSFASRRHMLLSGNTLASLEIFNNQTNHSVEGSLFSIVNHTRTSFGQRMLRKWFSQPLIKKDQIIARQDAVEEIVSSPLKIQPILETMQRLPDFEKDLATLYYKKPTRKQLFWMLTRMRRVAQKAVELVGVRAERKVLNSSLLKSILEDIVPAFTPVDACLAEINPKAAEAGSIEDYFTRSESLEASQAPDSGELSQGYEEIASQKDFLLAINLQFTTYLDDVKQELKRPSWKFVTHQTTDYLVEVPNAEVKAVPHNWIKNSGTKAVCRFDTPELIKFRKELNYHKEKLIETCNIVFGLFMDQVLLHFETLRKMIAALSTLDCLVSLATVSMQRGYTRPELVEEANDSICPTMKIVGARHPVIEELVPRYIPNDIQLGGHHDPRVLLITGPNMGGKSSYVRQVALICIMAQVGAYVPASSATLGIVDAVFTRIGAYDNLMAGESTFMVELKECCDIMKRATNKSLVILDEIGRGTGTMDGAGIAYGVLSYFIRDIKSLTLFVTHYPLLGAFEKQFPGQVSNCLLGVNISDTGKVIFTYKLEHGVAPTSYGLNVAQLAGLPQSVLDVAASKSHEMENQIAGARGRHLIQKIKSWISHPPAINAAEALIDSLGDEIDENYLS